MTMDSMVNSLLNSWDTVFTDGESRRNSFLAVPSTDQITSNSVNNGTSGNTSNTTATLQQPLATAAVDNTIQGTSIFNSSQLADKLVERLISMTLPPSSESQITQGVITERLEMQKQRPSLSVPLMSRNFILLNSRLSFPFELIDEIIRIMSWRNPNYTLSLLVILTNLILNPVLLVMSPLIYILYGIMSPAYLKHHPAEDNIFPSNPIPAKGSPLNDVIVPKAVPQLSREFVLNLTDLQNHMLLYVMAFDFIDWIIVEFCYFKDEAISSFIFTMIFALTTLVGLSFPVMINFLPMIKLTQYLILIMIWIFTISMHPNFREQLLQFCYSEETRLKMVTLTNKMESSLRKEFQYVEEQEIREVEIFEIQHLSPETKNWSFVCYSPDFYSINTTTRKLGLPIVGSQTLQTVQPPLGWDFIPSLQSSYQNSNWKLDLNPEKWVRDNYVQDVIEIDSGEKWCYDKCDDKSMSIRRRRWCREVMRSFQIDEILLMSKLNGVSHEGEEQKEWRSLH